MELQEDPNARTPQETFEQDRRLEELRHTEQSREQPDSREEAMQARLRLAAIVESSEDAIVGTDMDANIKDWNNAAVRLYGYSADEVIGKSISILAPPDRVDEVTEILKR